MKKSVQSRWKRGADKNLIKKIRPTWKYTKKYWSATIARWNMTEIVFTRILTGKFLGTFIKLSGQFEFVPLVVLFCCS